MRRRQWCDQIWPAAALDLYKNDIDFASDLSRIRIYIGMNKFGQLWRICGVDVVWAEPVWKERGGWE